MSKLIFPLQIALGIVLGVAALAIIPSKYVPTCSVLGFISGVCK